MIKPADQEPSEHLKRLVRDVNNAIKLHPGEPKQTAEDMRQIVHFLVGMGVTAALRESGGSADQIIPLARDVTEYLWRQVL